MNNEKRITAVERLVERLQGRFGNAIIKVMQDDIDISIELEKQQIVDASYHGSQNLPYEVKDKSEQYYTTTYGKD